VWFRRRVFVGIWEGSAGKAGGLVELEAQAGIGGAMSSLSRELVFLILQFLDEEKFKETVHKWVSAMIKASFFLQAWSDFWCYAGLSCRLEQESGFYFNMKHFEDIVTGGEWDEVEKYLSGFTKVEDNRYSMKIFFEIRKQKYLEALDRCVSF
jgi:hypothetical protein